MAESTTARGTNSTARAVRHHLALVIACVLLGTLAGWLYATSVATTYTSVTKVLLNPSVGNPYAPTPSSVRQDELTSLETEAQVVRSVEVLTAVAEQDPSLTTRALERGLRVTVPPNTQVLEIAYSATDGAVAQRVADEIATAYLANRQQRFDDVNEARIERVGARTKTVVSELRAASAAAEQGTPAQRAFQSELADALRSELVSLRAQRTALENSESPPGAVISPASAPAAPPAYKTVIYPVGGALAGAVLGCLLALLLERFAGVVRTASEVDRPTLPVVAAVPPARRSPFMLRRRSGDAFDATLRRLRAALLDLEPRPDVIAVAPAGPGRSDADVSEAVAESFARAGHRVVLVQTEAPPSNSGLGVGDRGLADALLHERLSALDLLRPSVEPLLCLLPSGVPTDQSRELLVADRLRALLLPLVEAGNIVVIQSPGVDTAEGEAFIGAADFGLVVVTLGVTRPREIDEVTRYTETRGTLLAGLVVGRRDAARRTRRTSAEDAEPEDDGNRTVTPSKSVRGRR